MRMAAQRLVAPALVAISILFIVLGKADVLLFERVRVMTTDVMAPVLSAVAQPLATIANGVHHAEDVMDIYGQNERLREENARLLQWQEVARRLLNENGQLRDLVKYQPTGASFSISAQVIANSGGAFARNVLVDVGARDKVVRGQAGVTGEGLIGRISEVGDHTARILLLTDLNSRIPIEIEGSHERAVMTGDNSDEPRLLYLPANTKVKTGDRIVTGGAEGVFPPGLPVGVVASIEGSMVRVEPYAELARLDYLRIVDLGLAGVLPQSAVPLPKAAKSAKFVDPDLAR